MKIDKLFNNIITNDQEGSERAFNQVIQDKLKDALEVRKVGLTAQIFNKDTVNESTDLEEIKPGSINTRTKRDNPTNRLATKSAAVAKKVLIRLKKKFPKDKFTIVGDGNEIEYPKDEKINTFVKAQADVDAIGESAELEEAKLEKPKGSPLEVQNKLGTMIAKAKTIKDISDDEYMSWYSNLDDKTYERWEKMVKADPQYKKAYTLGTQGGSDKPPFPKGTFAAAIWSNEYAAGAMDS